MRRRVKEQQKRIGAAEFRNTHFSYTMGAEGVEKFVSTPELQSQGGIGDEPLESRTDLDARAPAVRTSTRGCSARSHRRAWQWGGRC
ncbi:hypothetical protein [Acidovorax sp.]|uniref:hypothetical protein n=1 Tax=Acidovorax sp. TaxID=1872122 RepID=UPI002ACDCA70|nr:hypothetical protein [Acidovorax sp.]MDZ7862356.1 hypothetical protein [Acidovorax sp.]